MLSLLDVSRWSRYRAAFTSRPCPSYGRLSSMVGRYDLTISMQAYFLCARRVQLLSRMFVIISEASYVLKSACSSGR
jgi:hypothetical protein